MAKRGTKSRKLSGIKINEVSLVDLPANKQSFLFFKREGSKQGDPVVKAKKIKIAIESDGTVGSTTISVNGKKVSNLRSFDFSFYGTDPKQSIHASYSKESSDGDGFKRTETYYLSKGDVMKSELLKALQKFLGTDDVDFEKKVNEDEIQKALELITDQYQDSFPADLEEAVGLIAKRAIDRDEDESDGNTDDDKEDLKKAGAKFSKDVLKKLQAVMAAMDALKTVLPDTSTQKSADGTTDELSKQIAELSEAVAKMSGIQKTEKKTDPAELLKSIKTLSDRVKEMEEGGAVQKSITDDNENDDTNTKDNGKTKWPTITGQGKD